MTLNLTQKADQAIGWLVEYTGLNRTDVVNRAVQIYRFWEEGQVGGAVHLLRQPNGDVETVRIL